MALGLITITVMLLLHTQSTLIQQSREHMQRAQFMRVVYEETKRYLCGGGVSHSEVELAGQHIWVTIDEEGKEVKADGDHQEESLLVEQLD